MKPHTDFPYSRGSMIVVIIIIGIICLAIIAGLAFLFYLLSRWILG